MNSGRIGYVPGVFDMFHVGHLNILKNAKLTCDFLIAGVVSDERCIDAKGKSPVVPLAERLENRLEGKEILRTVVDEKNVDLIGAFCSHRLCPDFESAAAASGNAASSVEISSIVNARA